MSDKFLFASTLLHLLADVALLLQLPIAVADVQLLLLLPIAVAELLQLLIAVVALLQTLAVVVLRLAVAVQVVDCSTVVSWALLATSETVVAAKTAAIHAETDAVSSVVAHQLAT